MADPKGFLKTTERELPARRPVPVRIMDWKEVYESGDSAVLRRQAGRCMDCGIPFCHKGCPLGNLIPEWNDLTWRGEGRSAIERLHATNNFPEFTGRLCPAPCESSCVLGINQPAVTIKQIEVSIADEAFANGWVEAEPPARLTGKTVAVVGSGPAGPRGRAAAHPRRATPSPSTSAMTGSADCSATASRTSRWRRSTSRRAFARCATRARASAPASPSAWTSPGATCAAATTPS